MKKIAIAGIIVSVIIAVFPLLCMLAAGFLAHMFGCSLNEGSTSVCPTVFGDIGGLLYMMGIMGWFVFYTVPTGIAGTILFSVILAVTVLHKSTAKTPEQG